MKAETEVEKSLFTETTISHDISPDELWQYFRSRKIIGRAIVDLNNGGVCRITLVEKTKSLKIE